MWKSIFVISIVRLLFSSNMYSGLFNNNIVASNDNIVLDETITNDLEEYGNYMPLMDLGFAVGELCEAFRKNPLLKHEFVRFKLEERSAVWTQEIACYREMEDKFFRSQLRCNKAISDKYDKEISFIEKNLIKPRYINDITDDYIKEVINDASESYGISEKSSLAFALLIMEGKRTIRVVQESEALIEKYKQWLSAIKVTGIYTPWVHGSILQREKEFIIKQFRAYDRELAGYTIYMLKNTDVRYVD